MVSKSFNRNQQQKSRSAANPDEVESTSFPSLWPPPLQFDAVDKNRNTSEDSKINNSESDSPETRTILDSNISIQKKPEDSLKKLGAKAYTQGQDIVLSNTFNVNNVGDQKTFLHEVSHAMNNKNSTPSPTTSVNGVPVNDSTELESKADRDADNLHDKIGGSGINEIISSKSSFGSSQDQAIQRKETEDEEYIGERVGKINEISNQQEEFNRFNNEKTIPLGFSSENYDPDRPYEIRKGLEYSKLIQYLRKDIIHLVSENIRISEQLAREAAIKHISSDQGALVDKGYDTSKRINEGNRVKSGYRSGSGGRLGNTSVTSKAEYDLADKKVKENQAVLNQIGSQDPLIFIATNMGRADLLKGLKTGSTKQEKQAAISQIMALFHDFTSKTMQYARKSPFEFKPVIDQIKKGRRGPTGYDWSANPKIVSGIVAEAGFQDFISSLGPDIAALVLAIGSGFASGGLSTIMVAASLAAESATVDKAYKDMNLSEASSMANASEELSVLSKEIASGKKIEFFITAAGMFLGGTVDGIEIVGKSKNVLKNNYRKILESSEGISVTKISKDEYLSKFDGIDGEKGYLERRKAHLESISEAKEKGASDLEINNIKMSEADEKVTAELSTLLNKSKGEFASRLSSSIRKAGGWKKLLEIVGDDAFVRAGMEKWRSDIFDKLKTKANNMFDTPLIRTGSQAESDADILALMKGSASDLDTTIRGNHVYEVRKMMRDYLCDIFSCNPEKLGDYLDMTIFANTPVKAIINTVENSATREILLEEQARFEIVTMYAMLYKSAKKKGKDDTVAVLKSQMDNLKISHEELVKYEKLAEQDNLQKVIDAAMQKSEKLQTQIDANKAKIQKLNSSQSENAQELIKLEKENKNLTRQLNESYREAMKGTTLMDISDSESFWSHTGVMEVVFKQNDDFSYLVAKDYTPAQKQVMVVHDMAQLESKLMKLDELNGDFDQIQGLSNKMLKDVSKSGSRLANALAINATDESVKKQFAEISARLISNKAELSGPLSDEVISRFKKELQEDLIKMDALCKKQISEMGDSPMVTKYADRKMISEFQGEINAKIVNQQVSDMINRVLDRMGKSSRFVTRNIGKYVKIPSKNLSESQVDNKEHIAKANKAISQGNTNDAIENLFAIGEVLKLNGQNIKDFKFDLITRNFKQQFAYLKRKSAEKGGLSNNDDLKRAEFLKSGMRRLSGHIARSTLDEDAKAQVHGIIVQIIANLDYVISPVEVNSIESKQSPKKEIVKPNLSLEKEYFTAKDRDKLEEQKQKPILLTNKGSYSLSIRIGKGKYIEIKSGEQYYVNGNNVFLGKKK
jgi:hypothetical protein